MAKTVDSFSTIEDLRLNHNQVAMDVGDISGLNTTRRSNLTEAVNSINEREFFFQEFVYTGTLNQEEFTGADVQGNSLRFRKDRIQVFVRGEHLFEGVDYEVLDQNSDGSHSKISFNISGSPYKSGQAKAVQAGDKVVVYAYTGSFLGTALQSTGSTFWILDDSNAIFNNNAGGVILNGDNSSLTTDIQSGFTLQLAGKTFAEDDITLTTGKTLTAPTVTDGTASLSSGSLTSAVNGTFSGTVQAEQLTTTDDLTVGDDAGIGGILNVTGNLNVNTDKFNVVASNGNTSVAGTLGVTGNTTLTGNLTANGNVDLGNAVGDMISILGVVDTNIIPKSTSDNLDLGSSAKKWQAVHAGTFHGALDGNATTATTLQTARDIGGVSFNGSANIDLPGVNIAGDQNTSGNAATATKLATARDISGVSFDGSQNIELNTSHIDENSANLYFTNARADARIGLAGIGSLSNVHADANSLSGSGTDVGKILAWNGTVWNPVVQNDSDSVAEGSSNLYYTDARVSTRTDTILNHSNHSNISVTKVGAELRLTAAAQYGDTNVTSYLQDKDGPGITISNTGKISADVENGLALDTTSDTNKVKLDYEVINSSSLGGSAPSGSGDAIGHLYFVI